MQTEVFHAAMRGALLPDFRQIICCRRQSLMSIRAGSGQNQLILGNLIHQPPAALVANAAFAKIAQFSFLDKAMLPSQFAVFARLGVPLRTQLKSLQ
jgi:hypothetical protein